LKINSKYFEHNLRENIQNFNIIFLYGTNIGLVELLYKKALKILKVDINDPFSVSKLDGTEFKENPSILHDNICTLSIFSQKRFIMLDLMYISITKNIENVILEAIEEINENNFLFIKCGNLKQNAFLRYFQSKRNSILTPCYEENTNTIYEEISNLFSKHQLSFNKAFIKNLSLKFNSDSLTNKMEVDKIDTFLENNKNVTEQMLYSLISNNNEANLSKVVESCSNGNPSYALSYFENIYENQNTTIALIRMFVSHYKLIERILLLTKSGDSILHVVDNIKPPIFFKKKEFIIFQCKLWNLKLVNIILLRLIDLEIKCKLNSLSEKIFMSQFILLISKLAKGRVKT